MAFRPTTTCDVWLTPDGSFDPATTPPDFTGVQLQTQKALASIGTDQAGFWVTLAYLIFRFILSLAAPLPRVASTVVGTARPIIGIPDHTGELFEVRDVNRVLESDTISLQYTYCVPWVSVGPPPGTMPAVIDRENADTLVVGSPIGPAVPCASGDATLSFCFCPDHTDTVPDMDYSTLGYYRSVFGGDRECTVLWSLGPRVNGDAHIFSGSALGIAEFLVNVTGQVSTGPVFVAQNDVFDLNVAVSYPFTPTNDYLVLVFLMGDGTSTVTVPAGWVEVSNYSDLGNNRFYGMYYANFSAGTPFPGAIFNTTTSIDWTYGILYWMVP